MTDMVDHPPHYQTDSGLEAFDVIEAFFRTNYNLGQVFKYIARADKKWDDLEDLKKARWYLDKEIEWRESDDLDPEDVTVFSGTLAELLEYLTLPEFKVGDRVVCSGDTDVHNINGIGTVTAVDTEDTSSGLTVGVRLDNDPGLGWFFWYRPDQLERLT